MTKDHYPAGSALALAEELLSMTHGLRVIDSCRQLNREQRIERRRRVYAKASALGIRYDLAAEDSPETVSRLHPTDGALTESEPVPDLRESEAAEAKQTARARRERVRQMSGLLQASRKRWDGRAVPTLRGAEEPRQQDPALEPDRSGPLRCMPVEGGQDD